jgi:hypothetical protein
MNRPKATWAAMHLGLALALAAGIALRLVYPDDIEWKGDEQWTFNHAQLMVAGGPWPWLGMGTSVGPPNPGMSLWVFAGLFVLFGVATPPDLARAVQISNAAALVALAAFAFAAVPKERREYWLWAAALWAVNPLAVIFERKIWPPSVLPLASIAFIAAWWFRRRAGAAFAWGFVGALMAQVHLSAAVLAGAVAMWTLIRDRGGFPWKGWLAGTAIAALPALPWLFEMLHHGGGAQLSFETVSPTFFLRWATQPFGFGIDYTLRRAEMLDYLTGPVLAGRPTYVMALVHLVLAMLVLVILVQAVETARIKGWPGAQLVFLGTSSETVLITATLWGYGGVLTLLTLGHAGSHRHYLIAVAPLMALWAAMTVFYGDRTPDRHRARAILIALCVAQAVASAGLLFYIHETAVILGEYGPTWRSQQPGFVPPARR